MCQAEYHFLTDESDENYQGRSNARLLCQDYIDKAGKELKMRLLKFLRIDEFSQGNLSPSFSYWARLYFIQARLSLFFPTSLQEDIVKVITLLEKARIYAARDGDSDFYAKLTLYQSFCYLLQAYQGNQQAEFNQDKCIEWAKKLIDHGVSCYSESSKKAYQDYMNDVIWVHSSNIEKDERGRRRREKYGGIDVPQPPFIVIAFDNEKLQSDEKDEKTKKVAASLITIRKHEEDDDELVDLKDELIDLFGQHSAFYFFAEGMLKLCDNSSETEFIEQIVEAKNNFICCWAIAEGGAFIDEDNKLMRNFKALDQVADEYQVANLRGLYLHRLNELADLGKLFTVICQFFIMKSEMKQKWVELENLFNKNQTNRAKGILSEVKDIKYAEEQEYYSGHLKEKFKRILEELKIEYNADVLDFYTYRNGILQKIFECLRRYWQ